MQQGPLAAWPQRPPRPGCAHPPRRHQARPAPRRASWQRRARWRGRPAAGRGSSCSPGPCSEEGMGVQSGWVGAWVGEWTVSSSGRQQRGRSAREPEASPASTAAAAQDRTPSSTAASSAPGPASGQRLADQQLQLGAGAGHGGVGGAPDDQRAALLGMSGGEASGAVVVVVWTACGATPATPWALHGCLQGASAPCCWHPPGPQSNTRLPPGWRCGEGRPGRHRCLAPPAASWRRHGR